MILNKDVVVNFQPIYNYIRKRVQTYDKIKAVFLHDKEDVFDLWFVSEERNLSLELAISELIGDLYDIFDTILFDSLSFTIDEVDLEQLKQESYDIIYLKE